MKHVLFLILSILMIHQAVVGKENITPSIEPEEFNSLTEITVTYDVTGTPLATLEKAFIWVWIPGAGIDARYNVNPASANSGLTENAQFTKTVSGDKTLFSITFIPQDFFTQPVCQESQLGILLKGNDWNDGQTEDHLAGMMPLSNCFVVKLISPDENPVFIDPAGTLKVEATTSEAATFTLTINGTQVDQKLNVTTYQYNYTVPQINGIYPVELHARKDEENDTTITFSYLINGPSETLSRPAHIIPGINYHPSNPGQVTLCLLAPGKNAAYLLGEFNRFEIVPENQMYKDGNYFWKEITGLTPGKEYAYQYMVEGVYIADPFADIILDPEDIYIPSGIYPGLKSYPQEALKEEWYKNRLSVFQTGQSSFSWSNDNYLKPEREDLVIYELHIRDFFDAGNRNYLNLIDTLSYLKNLGVNAIELMPVQEFQGNSSWGYNPTFMFAPDKAYGTKEGLKTFIDAAHGENMAVIMDIVLNQQDIPNPYVALWFDFQNFKVTPDNPMFNVTATHPYSVFYDMNHQSQYSQFYIDTILNYWIREYHVDGYRFDLSKGFTQKVSGDQVGVWNSYDESRVTNIQRMAGKVWQYAPDTWLILEHFADNYEEKILSDFGLMLWGNLHGKYKEAILGYHEEDKSNLEWGYALERGWKDLSLVTYMESHDEERQMVDALQYGNSSGSYSVKDQKTALERIKLAAAFFLTIPGPKMIWQFGELGYDVSIEENGRTGEKPLKWEYFTHPERNQLYEVFGAINRFKTGYEVFESGNLTWDVSAEVKRMVLEDVSMQVVILGNFDVSGRMVNPSFTKTGTWFDFFTGMELTVTDPDREYYYRPGEFHIYTTEKIGGINPGLVPWQGELITGLEEENRTLPNIYPNPTYGSLFIQSAGRKIDELIIMDKTGKIFNLDNPKVFNDPIQISTESLPSGIYLLMISEKDSVTTWKFVKK